jgi:hypothetical protein
MLYVEGRLENNITERKCESGTTTPLFVCCTYKALNHTSRNIDDNWMKYYTTK